MQRVILTLKKCFLKKQSLKQYVTSIHDERTILRMYISDITKTEFTVEILFLR
jgi:hypothetical protein